MALSLIYLLSYLLSYLLHGVAENVNESEMRGLEKLRKRVDAKELVVVKTDKSGKLAIVEWEVYMAMGEKHVANDKVVE